MKALAVVALVFSGLCVFIPFMGVFLAMLCSLMALIAFRSQPTLAGITFGINIVSTAFLSPSLIAADVIQSKQTTGATESGDLYLFYVGWHVVLLLIAIAWRLIRGRPRTSPAADSINRLERIKSPSARP